MLGNGQGWSSIVAATGASRSTLARLAKAIAACRLGAPMRAILVLLELCLWGTVFLVVFHMG